VRDPSPPPVGPARGGAPGARGRQRAQVVRLLQGTVPPPPPHAHTRMRRCWMSSSVVAQAQLAHLSRLGNLAIDDHPASPALPGRVVPLPLPALQPAVPAASIVVSATNAEDTNGASQ